MWLFHPTHQHADDLTAHVASREEGGMVIRGAIRLHCEASGAQMEETKAKGMEIGVAEPFVGLCPYTGIMFVGRTEPIRHLGILLGQDTELCRQQLYEPFCNTWNGGRLSGLQSVCQSRAGAT